MSVHVSFPTLQKDILLSRQFEVPAGFVIKCIMKIFVFCFFLIMHYNLYLYIS